MMITALIIDDEPAAIDVLQIHAAKVPELKVLECFSDPFLARDFLKNSPVDMIFLDINMPGLSGLQILDQLSVRPLVVFTTAYSEYAVDSYNYQAIDYLLKPIEFDKFYRAVKRVDGALSNGRSKNGEKPVLYLKDGYAQVKVCAEDILYVKSDGNYLNVYTEKGKVNTRMTLKDLLDEIPDTLIRIHNSTAINPEKIDKIENNQIDIRGEKLSLGPSYRAILQEKLGLGPQSSWG